MEALPDYVCTNRHEPLLSFDAKTPASYDQDVRANREQFEAPDPCRDGIR